MIELSLAEVAAAVGGRLAGGADPAAAITGPVVVDSRHVQPGALFVALPGERADGHDYAPAAVAAGAVAVLATFEIPEPCIVVEDGVVALGALARAVLERLPEVTVVGITGSSGKTSTKDLLAQLLGRHGSTVAPAGSFNNEIGLPLTVLRADPQTRFLVLEYSARGIGHIALLTGIAPPRVAVELNVGTAHLGEFGDRATIARAKRELVEALPPAGVAVLNADDALVLAMAEAAPGKVVTYGRGTEAAVRAADVVLDDRGRASFTLHAAGESAPVRLQLYGEHQVANALAAAAAALELGMPLAEIAAALAEARPVSRWRMEVVERGDGVTVINDAYNANPDSMRAALRALVAMGGGRRTWAVLGEMAELGEAAGEEHDAIGRLVVRLDVTRLLVVGQAAARIHAGAVLEGSWGGESVHVPDAGAAVALLREELRAGDVVLVKASRAAGLEQVAEALLEAGEETRA